MSHEQLGVFLKILGEISTRVLESVAFHIGSRDIAPIEIIVITIIKIPAIATLAVDQAYF